MELSTQDDFEKIVEAGITLVDFNAPWCDPCRAQEPILEEIEKNFQGRANIAKVDIDKSREIALNLGIQSIPTIILFKGGEEVGRFVGLQTVRTLSQALMQALASRSEA
ncbi:MAG: thioredoxin [Desulfobacterales bacterium]|nr:thioredoxin [Desulfobacterales bacterium]